MVRLPNWPELFKPQHFTVPSNSQAQLWLPPAVTPLAMVVNLVTFTGFGFEAVWEVSKAPRPNWPTPFAPQQRTVPSDRRAQVCSLPIATAVAVVTRGTVTGVEELATVTCPS